MGDPVSLSLDDRDRIPELNFDDMGVLICRDFGTSTAL